MMKISEVAARTGMDVSTIRFYERKQLIIPSRSDDNLYRNYTESDLARLRQIMLCRKVNMPIEDIRRFVTGEVPFGKALETQLEQLEAEQMQLRNALELCKKMLADQADGQTDVEQYLDYVSTAEQKGKYFPNLLPLLDEIAEASSLPSMIGYPMANRILQHKFTRRLTSLLIVAVLVVFPAFMLIQHTMFFVHGEYGAMRLLGLALVSVLMISGFVGIIKEERE